MKKYAAVAAVAVLLLVWSASCASVQTNGNGPVANPMLHRVGTRIVDAQGNPVQLRGVNLGGWLLWEGWMFGGGFDGETYLRRQLRLLAGTNEAQAFVRAFHTNFIAGADLRRIAQMGFNTVRVPFNYRLLAGDSSDSASHGEGWALLDQLLDWCEQYRLYAVLDLHSAPGGQSVWWVADPGDNPVSLWKSPEHQRETVALWREVAAHFKNRAALAGYDLLNEPDPPPGPGLTELYVQIIHAIREEDPRHLIFLEGGTLGIDLPKFTAPPDENAAYSFHIYTWVGDDRKEKLAGYEVLAKSQNVPLWVGEFGENTREIIGSTVEMFNQHQEICGWAFWPWKSAPGRFPGLYTITIPGDWQKMMTWIRSPLFHPEPTPDEISNGMKAFLEAVKLERTEFDAETAKALGGRLDH